MQHLVNLRNYLSRSIPNLTEDKFFMSVVNGKDHDGEINYTVRLLLIDFRGMPFDVLSLVRRWLQASGRIIEPAVVPVLSFDCEIVDSESYDLEIDIPMQDHVVDGQNGTSICATPIWDEATGQFINPTC